MTLESLGTEIKCSSFVPVLKLATIFTSARTPSSSVPKTATLMISSSSGSVVSAPQPRFSHRHTPLPEAAAAKSLPEYFCAAVSSALPFCGTFFCPAPPDAGRYTAAPPAHFCACAAVCVAPASACGVPAAAAAPYPREVCAVFCILSFHPWFLFSSFSEFFSHEIFHNPMIIANLPSSDNIEKPNL